MREDRTVLVGGVRLRPSPGADVLDLALTGRTAEIDAAEGDMGGRVHVAVVLDDDPAGIDFGTGGQMGHRFFSPGELEPSGPPGEPAAPGARILVAGTGNVFLAGDGFGPAVAEALRDRPLPGGDPMRNGFFVPAAVVRAAVCVLLAAARGGLNTA
ncbi:hypothetical protein [Streptomyces sp. CNQ085]|uniref:hypothetical protein n=1 Tax=Streptomyces sp. CNQ085 TaxID=2886944 RepID=UPI001F5146C6|nr:hypothetical protein [Streptomyces sp. CNQ085]MCI0383068.1 hypothetical protein [Streptomyces sp. CNQ085]